MCTRSEFKNITDSVTAEAQRMFGKKLNKVILYGSYARGDTHEYSDIDIMILVNISAEELSPFRKKMAEISSDLSLGTEDCVVISVSIKDNETFVKHKAILPFYQNVLKDGVILYAA